MAPKPLLVRDVMTRDVVTLSRNDKLVIANDIMGLGRIRHIPVVDEQGLLAGIVSQRDLFLSGLVRALGYSARAQLAALDVLSVKEAMTTEVVTVSQDTPLADAARLMLEKKIGSVVVTSGKKIVGILTESDFVKIAVQRELAC